MCCAMAEGDDDYDFISRRNELFMCIHGIECSGPYRATGHLISQDSLHWSPTRGTGLAYGQRIGRTNRYGLGRRKRWHN